MKKSKKLRIKQMINETFKDLKKLPQICTYALEIHKDNLRHVVITKSIINGSEVPEGVIPLYYSVNNCKQCIKDTRKLVDYILDNNNIVYVRKLPQFRVYNTKIIIRIRLAYVNIV